MHTFKLRAYQEKAHNMIINQLKAIQSLLVVMPTGSGKSKTIISFIDIYKQHFNFVLVVYRKDLVNQLTKDLDFFGLNYGVIMGDDDRIKDSRIQVCSIDTLHGRNIYPYHDDAARKTVLIIDEADETTRPAYKKLIEIYKANGKNKIIGLTATAYDEALPHFDNYIIPVTAIELRDFYKALVDFDYIVPVTPLSFEGAKIEKGEFNPKFVESVSNTDNMIKTHFDFWLRYGDNRQTLVFCTSTDHAKRFADFANFYYGREIAIAVSAKTSSNERKKIYDDFSKGIYRFLVNVRLITRGVDIPEIGCILDLALTAKKNVHVQKLGRGSRPNPFYPNCIVIDCVGNVYHNMPFYYDRAINLKEKKRVTLTSIEKSTDIHRCAECLRIGFTKDFILTNKCSFCGAVYKAEKVKEVKYSKAKLKKLEMENASPEKIEQVAMINEFKKTLWKKMNLGKKLKWREAKIAAQDYMIKKYGHEKCYRIKGVLGL